MKFFGYCIFLAILSLARTSSPPHFNNPQPAPSPSKANVDFKDIFSLEGEFYKFFFLFLLRRQSFNLFFRIDLQFAFKNLKNIVDVIGSLVNIF